MLPAPDTIFALSSGRPPAAIAVVRMSGPQAGVALTKLIDRLPAPRQAALARVRDPATREVIDEALALWFPGPQSETGEDVAELQLHGGRAVVAAVLAALGGIEGLRPAEAGEFTRRAFENGRLDLTAIEGLADLIYAETEAQRRQAYRQMKGLLGDRAETWRKQLIDALALVEARIDFSDEVDVPEELVAPALEIARKLEAEIRDALVGAARGERLRDGLVVAIAGPPNVGKSTLLNRIAKREVAIVSSEAGTTRDVIEVHLDLDGYPVTLLDTAGIRDSADPVEREGVRRARARAGAADLILWVVDASAKNASATPASNFAGRPIWLVQNKEDIMSSSLQNLTNGKDEHELAVYIKDLLTSALTGKGMDQILKHLASYAAEYFGAEPALVTRERQRQSLQFVADSLDRAQDEALRGKEDLVAEELRLAARALGRLTGRVDVEDILDVIFRDFCIGK